MSMSLPSSQEHDESLYAHPATQGHSLSALVDPTPSDEEASRGGSSTPSTFGDRPVVDDEEAAEDEEKLSPSQKLWPVRAILGERRGEYLLAWDGEDEHGKPYEPTWEAKSNATPALVADWEASKAAKLESKKPKTTRTAMDKKGKRKISVGHVNEVERPRKRSTSTVEVARPKQKGKIDEFKIRADSETSDDDDDSDVVLIDETVREIPDSQPLAQDVESTVSSTSSAPIVPVRAPLAELSSSSSSEPSTQSSTQSDKSYAASRIVPSINGSTVTACQLGPVPVPTATAFYPDVDPIEDPDSSPPRATTSRLVTARRSLPNLCRSGSKTQLELVVSTSASSGSASACSDENSSISQPIYFPLGATRVAGPFSAGRGVAMSAIPADKVNMLRPPTSTNGGDDDDDAFSQVVAPAAFVRNVQPRWLSAHMSAPALFSSPSRAASGEPAAPAMDGDEGSTAEGERAPTHGIPGLSAPEGTVSTSEANGSGDISVVPSSSNGGSSFPSVEHGPGGGGGEASAPVDHGPLPTSMKRDLPADEEDEQQSKKAKTVEFAVEPPTTIDVPASHDQADASTDSSAAAPRVQAVGAPSHIAVPAFSSPFIAPTQPLSPALARVQAAEPVATQGSASVPTADKSSTAVERQRSSSPSLASARPAAGSSAVSRNASPAPGGGSHLDGLIQLVHASPYISDTDSTKAEIERFLRDPKAYAAQADDPLCRVAHWAFELRHVVQEGVEKIDFIIVHSQAGTFQLKRVAAAQAQFDFARSLSHASSRARGLTPSTPTAATASATNSEPALPTSEPPQPIESMSRETLERELTALRTRAAALSTELDSLRPLAAESAKLRVDVATLTKQNRSLSASKESAQSDFAYMQAQYSEASTAAVMRAQETAIAEAETQRLRGLLDRGLKQHELMFKGENQKLKFIVKRLEGGMALLKAERKRVAESEVVKKAALWDDFQAELRHHEAIEEDMERGMSSEEDDDDDDDDDDDEDDEEEEKELEGEQETKPETQTGDALLSSGTGETAPTRGLLACDFELPNGRCGQQVATREELEEHLGRHEARAD